MDRRKERGGKIILKHFNKIFKKWRINYKYTELHIGSFKCSFQKYSNWNFFSNWQLNDTGQEFKYSLFTIFITSYYVLIVIANLLVKSHCINNWYIKHID